MEKPMTESNRIEYKQQLTDSLEITSAGSIYPGQEQDDFFAGYSMPRNKALMRIFKDLKMVEYLGSGMPRILKAYPHESYTFSGHFIRTSFCISAKALALEEEIMLEVTKKGGAIGGAMGGAMELTQRQKEILSIIQNNSAISYRALAEQLAINQSAVSKHLNLLKEKGVLKRIGGTRGYLGSHH